MQQCGSQNVSQRIGCDSYRRVRAWKLWCQFVGQPHDWLLRSFVGRALIYAVSLRLWIIRNQTVTRLRAKRRLFSSVQFRSSIARDDRRFICIFGAMRHESTSASTNCRNVGFTPLDVAPLSRHLSVSDQHLRERSLAVNEYIEKSKWKRTNSRCKKLSGLVAFSLHQILMTIYVKSDFQQQLMTLKEKF
jgi:hypothetical protein